jgi:hypothetical protein
VQTALHETVEDLKSASILKQLSDFYPKQFCIFFGKDWELRFASTFYFL